MVPATTLLFVLIFATASFAAGAQSESDRTPAEVSVRVRDAHSGQAVTGSIRIGPAAASRRPLAIDAPGYRPLTTTLGVGGVSGPVTIWLDRLEPDVVCAAAQNRVRAQPGRLLVHGHVVDDRGRAVAGASISLTGTDSGATTDEHGRFELESQVVDVAFGELPSTGDLRASRAGFADHIRRGMLLTGGATHLIVELRSGTGEREVDARHKMLRLAELPLQQTTDVPRAVVAPAAPRGPGRAATFREPPATIRVGTNCVCKVCTGVDVMSLETYVKRGMNDEWIASWSQDSLRAGSVPYRSYGVWHVENPIDPAFDICSTTCCQVNDPDTHSNTNLAADRTPGIMLEQAGVIFRAEYSAENNGWDDPNDGLSCSNLDLCGNGLAGSPSTGWPCLLDGFGSGHGCFGHGRGMCQWGSQRWATSGGRLWNWTVDHYYNDNDAPLGLRSAYMTSPLAIDGVVGTPAAVQAGQATTLQLDARNLASLPHTKISIGASLWSAATGFISDSSGDTAVVLAPGDNSVSRPFAVPAGTPDGFYDLIVALWLDVDENVAISPDDFAAADFTTNAGIEVCSDPLDVGDTLRVDRGSGDVASLSWSAAPGGTGYTVYRASAPDGSFAAIATGVATMFDDAGDAGVLAFYKVTTTNGCGESDL